jgi:hypothetical protein
MLGHNEETVNKALKSARTEEERKITLGAYFREAGLGEDYENFKKQNEALVESATALQEFNTALNELAVTTLPLLTPALEGLATTVGALEPAIQKIIDAIELLTTGGEKNSDLSTAGQVAELLVPGSTTKAVELNQNIEELNRGEMTFVDFLAGKKTNGTESPQEIGVIPWLINQIVPPAGAEGATGLTPNAEMSKYVTLAGQSAKSTQTSMGFGIEETVAADVEAAEQTAKAGGEAIGSNLTTGLQSQSLRLMLVAAQQRALLEKVWAEPITPTVVVGYQMAGPVNKNPTSINVNVAPADVNVNGNTLAKVLFKPLNTLLGLDAE